VLGALRGGPARIVTRTRGRLCSGAPAHSPSRPRKWSASRESRRERTVARRPSVRRRTAEANATGIGWCRRVAGRKPHSRARVERSSGVPARRTRLQKSASFAEAQRSASPAGKGSRGRGPSSRTPERTAGGAKAEGARSMAAKPRSGGSPKPGAREGVAGRRSLHDGRHPGSPQQRASVTRARGGWSRRPPRSCMSARAASPPRGRRQGCQRFGPHASRREENAHRDELPRGRDVRPAEANRPERGAGDLLECAGAQASDAPRADEARVLVRRT